VLQFLIQHVKLNIEPIALELIHFVLVNLVILGMIIKIIVFHIHKDVNINIEIVMLLEVVVIVIQVILGILA
jgi:hypothetical protein